MSFYSISSDIDDFLSISPFANVFVFGDFQKSHQKDWLTYSGGTDRPGELCYSFSILNDLTQMVNFPTQIPDCGTALLDFFPSSDASICSTMAFPPTGNSDHVIVSVSIDFLSNSNSMPCLITELMTILVLIGMLFVIIWEMFQKRISLNWVLLLLLVNFVSRFRLELMYILLIISTRSILIPWFSATCAAAIVHKTTFFIGKVRTCK